MNVPKWRESPRDGTSIGPLTSEWTISSSLIVFDDDVLGIGVLSSLPSMQPVQSIQLLPFSVSSYL